jgi:hypothetical protein
MCSLIVLGSNSMIVSSPLRACLVGTLNSKRVKEHPGDRFHDRQALDLVFSWAASSCVEYQDNPATRANSPKGWRAGAPDEVGAAGC